MRGAWLLAMPVVLSSVCFLGVANAAGLSPRADGPDSSVYVTRLPVDGPGNPERLLPIQGVDLPVVTAIDTQTESHPSPAQTPVEAIPTPTAFQAGLLVLVIIALSRWLRKLARV